MKLSLSLLLIYLLIIAALIGGSIMMANATSHPVEVIVFKPDGTMEICITYEDGITYCR